MSPNGRTLVRRHQRYECGASGSRSGQRRSTPSRQSIPADVRAPRKQRGGGGGLEQDSSEGSENGRHDRVADGRRRSLSDRAGDGAAVRPRPIQAHRASLQPDGREHGAQRSERANRQRSDPDGDRVRFQPEAHRGMEGCEAERRRSSERDAGLCETRARLACAVRRRQRHAVRRRRERPGGAAVFRRSGTGCEATAYGAGEAHELVVGRSRR